jgi:hypothetical protein
MLKFWFILFVVTRGADGPGTPEVSLGPFPSEAMCYAMASVLINKVNPQHPDRDFRGACVNGVDIVLLPELAKRATTPDTQ